ncbi:hypothetical protein BGZ83_002182 [Gryganskiella cystojenkinii]|nr:hypothetical protein BGZ83_002182 [Gryganskiella cystojenkinii]
MSQVASIKVTESSRARPSPALPSVYPIEFERHDDARDDTPFPPSDSNRKKKKHGRGDDDGSDEDRDDDDEHHRGKHENGDLIRAKLLKAALKRREDEIENLERAYDEVLEGKRPFDPPKGYGYHALRAWTHSLDQHSYRDRLEKAIENAEECLEKLEELL